MPAGPTRDPRAAGSLTGGIVLAGGGGSRLGGVDKPALEVDGRPMLATVLAALGDVADAGRTVVVGPDRHLPPPLMTAWEDPPGAGPAAAAVSGLARLAADPPETVFLLAADLPGLTAATLRRLAAAATDRGAVLLDAAGREQFLVSAWPLAALAHAARSRSDWRGAPLRLLLADLPRTHVPAIGAEAADIDTADDLRNWHG